MHFYIQYIGDMQVRKSGEYVNIDGVQEQLSAGSGMYLMVRKMPEDRPATITQCLGTQVL